VQNFTIRNGEPSQAFQKWIDEVAKAVNGTLLPSITPEGMMLDPVKYKLDQLQNGYCLAEIPSFTGLIPRSQRGRMPVYEVPDNLLGVGTVLDQYKIIRDRFLTVFNRLADDVENMTS
jgi:chromosome partitioning protein